MPQWKIGPLGDLGAPGGLLGGLGDRHQVDLGGLLEGHRPVGLGSLGDRHLADFGDLGDLHLKKIIVFYEIWYTILAFYGN